MDHFDHVACSRQFPGSALRDPWRPPIMNEAVAIRVFVLNDDQVVRHGLSEFLESVPWGLQIATSGREVWRR